MISGISTTLLLSSVDKDVQKSEKFRNCIIITLYYIDKAWNQKPHDLFEIHIELNKTCFGWDFIYCQFTIIPYKMSNVNSVW